MGTPGGRGTREGSRYRLLAGVQEDSPVASPRGRFWVRTGRLEQEVRELWMKDRQVLMDWKRE